MGEMEGMVAMEDRQIMRYPDLWQVKQQMKIAKAAMEALVETEEMEAVLDMMGWVVMVELEVLVVLVEMDLDMNLIQQLA
jgi:hypothetical protein